MIEKCRKTHRTLWAWLACSERDADEVGRVKSRLSPRACQEREEVADEAEEV